MWKKTGRAKIGAGRRALLFPSCWNTDEVLKGNIWRTRVSNTWTHFATKQSIDFHKSTIKLHLSHVSYEWDYQWLNNKCSTNFHKLYISSCSRTGQYLRNYLNKYWLSWNFFISDHQIKPDIVARRDIYGTPFQWISIQIVPMTNDGAAKRYSVWKSVR